MPTLEQVLPYIYGGVSIFLIVFLWMAYNIWKVKRMIKKEIENPNY